MISLSSWAWDRLRCPLCHASLERVKDSLTCVESGCGAVFPVVRGVPILINERNSVFRLEDFAGSPRELLSTDQSSLAARLKRLVPGNGDNLMALANFRRLRRMLTETNGSRVLVVGGGVLGQGIAELFAEPAFEFVETDVWIAPRTQLVCDAHDLPFDDGTFDAVVAQAVLEHVADPGRCAAEIHRVLRPRGFVYAETPFMQQVHLGPYDFTRFTHLGHRRLFGGFDEIDSGAVSGPGLALMWAYESFLLGFVTSPIARNLTKAFARFTSFPFKYFDRYLIKRPAGLDGACALYFLGQKSERQLADRELIAQYRGAQAAPRTL
jgi:SAM-dependent methyltransferase/uncharacterized protein YbaR (Trm112 family)